MVEYGFGLADAPEPAEAPGEPYSLTAERDAVVVTADLVRSSRELFQKIVSLVPGAEYDGWEVSVRTDEYLQARP